MADLGDMDLLFSGLGDLKSHAGRFLKAGLSAFGAAWALDYGADFAASKVDFLSSSKAGPAILGGGQALLGAALGAMVATKDEDIGIGIAAGGIATGLAKIVKLVMPSLPVSGLGEAQLLYGLGYSDHYPSRLGTAPLLTEASGMSGAPLLVNEEAHTMAGIGSLG